MPRYIVKLQHGNTPYYLEWSTIVDAPVTYGMSLEEFNEYYKDTYGTDGMHGLPERMARVEEKGTSAINDDSGHETISFNRAGKNETCLSVEQIIEWYCVKQKEPQIEGTRPWEEESE